MAVQYSETHLNRSPLQEAAGKRLVKFGKGLLSQMLQEARTADNLPDPQMVPWQELEDEVKREISIVLVLLFMQSYDGWEVSGGDPEADAMIFAQLRAQNLATKFMDVTRKRYTRLKQRIDVLRGVLSTAESEGWDREVRGGYDRLRGKGRDVDPLTGAGDGWSPAVPDAEARSAAAELAELEDAVQDLFSPERMESVARTEATRGISAGTLSAARMMKSVEVYWRLGPNENHCPFCSKLHNTPKSFWSRFSDGPPAHPNCQCALEVVKASYPTMVFPDSLDMEEILDGMELSGAMESVFWMPERFLVESVPLRSLRGLWAHE